MSAYTEAVAGAEAAGMCADTARDVGESLRAVVAAVNASTKATLAVADRLEPMMKPVVSVPGMSPLDQARDLAILAEMITDASRHVTDTRGLADAGVPSPIDVLRQVSDRLRFLAGAAANGVSPPA